MFALVRFLAALLPLTASSFSPGQPANTAAQAPPSVPEISSAAADYLNHVIDLMQQNALHRNEINFTLLRSDAFARAGDAQTPTDTYPAIFYALTQLKEYHSFLRIPDHLSDADKKRAWASMNTILVPYKKQFAQPPPSPFSKRSEPDGHLIRSGNLTFAWVSIPACADSQAFADKLHSIATGLEAQHPNGWIIDLRGNGGGNMWPMLAGIGFVLGDGTSGYFVGSDGNETPWSYQDGKASLGERDIIAFVTGAPLKLAALPPVAVLIDSGTISSGEAIAVSFAGRPLTRFFGTHTYGLSSANQMFTLSDGASLFLNTAADEDRNHRRYDNGIEPDVAFPEPTTLPDEASDPVLQAAEAWLATQAR